MSDADCLSKLIDLGFNPASLDKAEAEAAKSLYAFDKEHYPADGCAITQSWLLRNAGIDVPLTYQALALGNLLEKRGWQRIAVGDQKDGDLGSTCGMTADHGEDHIYLVLRVLNKDELLIADNQSTRPHFRWASGKGGKTPTTHFLRAP